MVSHVTGLIHGLDETLLGWGVHGVHPITKVKVKNCLCSARNQDMVSPEFNTIGSMLKAKDIKVTLFSVLGMLCCVGSMQM